MRSNDYHKGEKKQDFVRTNERIRIPRVLVIDENNQNIGEVSNKDALAMARAVGLDLVEVSPNARPPVCRIMDYGKFMYERQKKTKNKGAVTKEKEISFRYVISEHDMATKANQAKKFLEQGHRVKLMVFFEKREKAHKQEGFVVMTKMYDLLKEVAQMDNPPIMEGGNIIARLDLKKAKKDEQGSRQKPAN